MPTSPTPITALPAAPNPDADEATFDNDAYAWSAALPNFRAQVNAIGSVTYTNAQEAAASAVTATTQAELATSNGAAQVALAAAQVALATTQAGIATTKAVATAADAVATAADRVQTGLDRTAAAASAASAAAVAGAFVGTSTSSVTIGSGNKTFITQAGEQYTPGVFMTAVSAANSSNYMAGQVVSYSGTTLIISVSVTGGSGTFTDWNLSIAGPQGAQGPVGPAGAGITPQTVGFTLTGGATPKTLTVALDASVSGANTGDQSGGDATKNLGYLNIPQNSQSAAYTTVLADAGKHIYHPSADTTARTFTIPANSSVAYPLGTAITFINDTSAGVVTISIATDTIVLAGTGATGNRTLAANGIATAIKTTATRWMISGTNLT